MKAVPSVISAARDGNLLDHGEEITCHLPKPSQSFSQAFNPSTKLPARMTMTRSISHHHPARALSLEIPKIEATAERARYRRLFRRITHQH